MSQSLLQRRVLTMLKQPNMTAESISIAYSLSVELVQKIADEYQEEIAAAHVVADTADELIQALHGEIHLAALEKIADRVHNTYKVQDLLAILKTVSPQSNIAQINNTQNNQTIILSHLPAHLLDQLQGAKAKIEFNNLNQAISVNDNSLTTITAGKLNDFLKKPAAKQPDYADAVLDI